MTHRWYCKVYLKEIKLFIRQVEYFVTNYKLKGILFKKNSVMKIWIKILKCTS